MTRVLTGDRGEVGPTEGALGSVHSPSSEKET